MLFLRSLRHYVTDVAQALGIDVESFDAEVADALGIAVMWNGRRYMNLPPEVLSFPVIRLADESADAPISTDMGFRLSQHVDWSHKVEEPGN